MAILGKEILLRGRLVRIACLDGEKYNYPDDPEVFVARLRKSRAGVDIFTFLQRPPETAPRYPYVMEMDNLAVLPVSTFENWWNNQIRYAARNHARQASKHGVVIREVPFGEELLEGICGIYNETPIRQGKRFRHYGMTRERARAYAGTFLDRSIFIGAFLDTTMIGFIKLTMDENCTQAHLIHILSMVQHRDKSPTNALVAEAVRACAERDIQYLVYDNFSYGNKVGDSLARFKKANGFGRVDVPRYYVPMTMVGKVALWLGLHHRIAEQLPESLAGKFRDLRKIWYNFRFPAPSEP